MIASRRVDVSAVMVSIRGSRVILSDIEDTAHGPLKLVDALQLCYGIDDML